MGGVLQAVTLRGTIASATATLHGGISLAKPEGMDKLEEIELRLDNSGAVEFEADDDFKLQSFFLQNSTNCDTIVKLLCI